MNKLLLAVLLVVMGVLVYSHYIHDPVPPADPASALLGAAEKAPRTAPPAPTLEVTAYNEGFHTKGQWRGNPAVADLNGDGHLDLVTSIRRWDRQTMGDGLFVYLGDGKGSFTESIPGLERKLGYGGAAIRDVDDDGHPDIAFSGHDQTPRVYMNFLHDENSPSWICSTPGGVDTGAICSDVGLGDFTRDGHVDLVTVGQFPRQGGVLLWPGDGEGGFATEPIQIKDKENYGSRAELADMDGDGYDDLVVALDIGSRVFKWDPETKTAIDMCEDFEDNTILGSDLALATHDFDGDGKREMIVGGYTYEGHESLRIFRLDEDGKWKRWGEGLPNGESFFDIKMAKIGDDGKVRMFAGGQWGIVVIEQTEVGKFEMIGRVPDSAKIFNLAAGDFTGDGNDDVVWIGEGGVRVFDLGWPLSFANDDENPRK